MRGILSVKKNQLSIYQLFSLTVATLIIGLFWGIQNTYADTVATPQQSVFFNVSTDSSSAEQSTETPTQQATATVSSSSDSASSINQNDQGQSASNKTIDASSKSEATTPAVTQKSVVDDQAETLSSSTDSSVTETNSSQSVSSDSIVNNQSSSQATTASQFSQSQSSADSTSDVSTADSSSASVTSSADKSDGPSDETDKDQITVSGTADSSDPTIKQSSSNPLLNWLTNLTSAGAASLIYPFVTSRQGSHLISQFRTLLSPTRYNIDKTWSDLDQKYDPDYTKQFYTEAKNWYDNEVTKQTLTVPFADGSGNASATYIAHPGSTKTIIYGQGWTTEPEWMGYISKIFYDMGYNVLMPYTRGQNGSDGEFMTFGYKDKADWTNWINKVDQINGPDSEDILYGQSLGADDALEAAAQKNLPSSVKAVIADCGYSTIPSLLYSLYTGAANKLNGYTSKIGWNLNGSIPLVPYDQFLNNLNKINHFVQGFNLDDASGLTAVKNSTLPTLFIATADDTFIPDSETKALYNASNSEYKQLWILDGNVGGHASANNAVLAYKQHIQNFLNAVENGQTTPANTASPVVNTQNAAA